MFDHVTCRTARTAMTTTAYIRAEIQFNLAWGGVKATLVQIIAQMRQSFSCGIQHLYFIALADLSYLMKVGRFLR